MGAYLRVSKLNAKQVQRYLSAYSAHARIKAHADLMRVAELYREIETRGSLVSSNGGCGELGGARGGESCGWRRQGEEPWGEPWTGNLSTKMSGRPSFFSSRAWVLTRRVSTR